MEDTEITSSYDTILLSVKTTDNMSRLIYALRCIKENYIILSLEDFFLYTHADTKQIPEDTPYRFNFQVDIWRRDFLLTLLQNYTNIWGKKRLF